MAVVTFKFSLKNIFYVIIGGPMASRCQTLFTLQVDRSTLTINPNRITSIANHKDAFH